LKSPATLGLVENFKSVVTFYNQGMEDVEPCGYVELKTVFYPVMILLLKENGNI
jgi:hypothetical protein